MAGGLAEGWEEKLLKELVGKSPEAERFIALTTTVPIAWGELKVEKTTSTGDTAAFPVGDLEVTLS